MSHYTSVQSQVVTLAIQRRIQRRTTLAAFTLTPPPVSDWDAQVSYMGVGELASAFDLDLNGAEVKDTPTDEDDVVLASIGLAGSAIMPPRSADDR